MTLTEKKNLTLNKSNEPAKIHSSKIVFGPLNVL